MTIYVHMYMCIVIFFFNSRLAATKTIQNDCTADFFSHLAAPKAMPNDGTTDF